MVLEGALNGRFGMSEGKYLSLEEARKRDLIKRFCEEHPSEAERERFFRLLDAMSTGVLEDKETSPPDRGEGSGGTQTRKGTS
jgi:hypothetical protein